MALETEAQWRLTVDALPVAGLREALEIQTRLLKALEAQMAVGREEVKDGDRHEAAHGSWRSRALKKHAMTSRRIDYVKFRLKDRLESDVSAAGTIKAEPEPLLRAMVHMIRGRMDDFTDGEEALLEKVEGWLEYQNLTRAAARVEQEQVLEEA